MVALALSLALAGCGEVIDKSKTQAQIKADLESSLPKALESSATGEELGKSLGITPHEKIASVDCPSEQSIDPGTTFVCSVEFSNGSKASETLKILNKEADLKVVGLKPEK
jgi:Domain of unknown function (DUF4333)